MSGHAVTFYEDDRLLAWQVSGFIAAGLEAGGAAVIIATAPHRDAIEAGLRARGLLGQAADSSDYMALDAAETLATFMRQGMPDAQRFEDGIGAILSQASDGGRRPLYLFGEMVALLFEAGDADAAIRLEELWNGLAKRHSFSLLCAYPIGAASRQQDRGSLIRICAEHTQAKLPDDLWMSLSASLQ